jgi:acyl carrier protein
MSEDELAIRLIAFIRANFLEAGATEQIGETTPLLALGVLDSLRTAMLLNFIRDDLGTAVSPMLINAGNFKDVRSIAAMVAGLASGSAAGPR